MIQMMRVHYTLLPVYFTARLFHCLISRGGVVVLLSDFDESDYDKLIVVLMSDGIRLSSRWFIRIIRA
jgi:hypothetical protein